MQQWAYTTKVHDINELKHILFDQRLAWFGIRHQQWCNWWLAQTSVCVCVFMPKHVIWFNIFNFMLILWKLEAKWCYCVKYDRILLFLIVLCISQEIVPNCLRYSGKYKIIFCKFTTESHRERILNTAQYLPMLCTWYVFFTHLQVGGASYVTL